MKHKILLGIMAIAAVLLLLSGCIPQTIEQVKKEENVGKTVAVSGTAENSIKLGKLSGYTLVDKNGDRIGVSTNSLPDDSAAVTARGVLMKDTLLGYYIKAD